MKFLLLIVIGITMIVSCKGKDGIPNNMIGKEKMQAILEDMMRADQFFIDYIVNKDSTFDQQKGFTSFYQQILDIHDVSRDKFSKSFAYYRSNPELLKTIMDSISKIAPIPIQSEPKLVKDSSTN
jgi:hypothetical protein